MTKRQHTVRSVFWFAAVLAIGATPLRAGGTIEVSCQAPIVAGENIYAGGKPSLVPVAGGSMVSLRMDGHAVALYFVENGRVAGVVTEVLLKRRDNGSMELVGLRESDGRTHALRLLVSGVLRAPLPPSDTRIADSPSDRGNTDTRPPS